MQLTDNDTNVPNIFNRGDWVPSINYGPNKKIRHSWN